MNLPESLQSLRGGLIVSCQADPQDAFYGLMDRFAQAAVAGGAVGIRANGPEDIRAICRAVDLPVIGIQKRTQADGKVLITPSVEDARALVEAGAAAVALDCTERGQEYGALERLRQMKQELRVPVLADIATEEEAQTAAEAGADVVLSTMRGYTDETAHIRQFEPAFIERLVRILSVPVIAEGRVDTPELARAAIRAGAAAVIVGSAITRPHLVTQQFAEAVMSEFAQRSWKASALGIDLGGTNTKFGLVTGAGELLWQDQAPTPAASGRGALLQHLAAVSQRGLLRSREGGYEPAAIGIATAGWVDPQSGRVVYATENLPGWTGAPIADEIRSATGMPVYVENDANALALGEAAFGAGRGLTDFVCITLGTGVGGGCYLGGRLNRGAHFFANAIGHICIHPGGRACTCGLRGCLETYTNAAALLGYAEGRYTSNEQLIAAAHAGEAPARAAIQKFADELAIGCSILLQLFDPEALILAGGLVQNNPFLLPDLEARLPELVTVWPQRRLRILTSTLGYYAGVLGAAAIAQ